MPFDLGKAPKIALVADLFCGAGGSSTGARRALAKAGYTMSLVAVNHWDTAIATHSKNHPEARHYCEGVNKVKPSEVVPEGKLDLLMASPTCTFHSRARGGKPINDQGRMDPWAVVHWCTELRVKRLMVENVPEFRDWGPIDLRTGRPLKRRKGEYFRAWIAALQGAGFRVEYRVLNAADFGDATTRERFFLLARSDGRRINWPEPTHSRTGDTQLFGSMKKWRSAREIIDWNIEGKSIFNRKKALSPKTLARIYAGARKFNWPEPFLVILRNHMDGQSLDSPVPTICSEGNHIGLAQPFLLNRHGENGGVRAHSLDEPTPTADCRGAGYVVEPFVVNLAHTGSNTTRCKAVAEPLQTLHAGGGSHGVMPVTHADGGNRSRSFDEPLPTVTGAHRGEIACIVAAYGERHGQEPRVHSVEEPAPTICAQGRIQLAVAVQDIVNGRYDIRFRMLEPEELASAMGFDADEIPYEFTGTKTDRTKQIGNAVPVNIATALVAAIMGN